MWKAPWPGPAQIRAALPRSRQWRRRKRRRRRRKVRMGTANPKNGKMSFWSHLDELRKRIVNAAIAIGVGFVLCFAYSEEILGLLLLPMNATISFALHYPFIT